MSRRGGHGHRSLSDVPWKGPHFAESNDYHHSTGGNRRHQTLRLSGQGEAGPAGGPAGNLFINFTIKSHPLFSRQGKQVLSAIGINVAQAMLVTKSRSRRSTGDVSLKPPPGRSSGQRFRLRHRGVPDMRGGDRGDQIVTVHVNIPGTLTRSSER